MKQLFIICLCAISPSWFFAQQEINFTVNIDSDSINLNETIDILYKIEGTDYRDFLLPQFEGFRVVSGPFQSTSIQYVNGAMSRETSYGFKLLAIEDGTFTFPPATIIVGDETLETEPVRITVMGDGSVKPRLEKKPYKTLEQPFERPSRKKPKTIYSI